MRLTAMLFIPLILLWACGTSGPDERSGSAIRLEVELDDPRPGGGVALLLMNASAGAIGYNLCTSTLERQIGGEWTAERSDRICTMELRTLPPGEETQYPYDLPPDLRPGEYRVLAGVELMDGGGRETVVSEAFTVQ